MSSKAVLWTALLGHMTLVQAGVYTCVDDKGRKILSDRPIAQCNDRTQKEMSSSGTVKRVLGPSLTAQERAAQEEKDKLAAREQIQQAEEKRLDRALLLRYPRPELHAQARVKALAQVDEVIRIAKKRALELALQRRHIDAQLSSYASNPSQAPASLVRQRDDNQSNMDMQNRFLATQEAEKERINAYFDEELTRLKRLWATTSVINEAGAEAAPVLVPASNRGMVTP